MEDYSSMYSSLPAATSQRLNIGISTILNQPVAKPIIVMQVRLTLFLIIAPPSCCFLLYLLYGPIRSTFTESHGFISAIILGCRCQKKVFIFLELLTYLARLRIQICLRDKTFTITEFLNYFCKYTTRRVVKIDMVTLQHTSEQS